MIAFEKTLKNFQNYILNQTTEINGEINELGFININSRLQIYRNAYYLRLLEVLAHDFKMLRIHLGQDKFNQLGKRYIQCYPSNSTSILEFSHHFKEFLSSQKKISKKQIELAEFELALKKACSTVLKTTLCTEKLSNIEPYAWANIHFVLNPSITQFYSFWQAPQLWRQLANIDADDLSSINHNATWLIWGVQGTAHFKVLTPQTQCFLEALILEKNFGEVCESLCRVIPEEKVGEFAGHCLNQWIMDQIIVKFELRGNKNVSRQHCGLNYAHEGR